MPTIASIRGPLESLRRRFYSLLPTHRGLLSISLLGHSPVHPTRTRSPALPGRRTTSPPAAAAARSRRCGQHRRGRGGYEARRRGGGGRRVGRGCEVDERRRRCGGGDDAQAPQGRSGWRRRGCCGRGVAQAHAVEHLWTATPRVRKAVGEGDAGCSAGASDWIPIVLT